MRAKRTGKYANTNLVPAPRDSPGPSPMDTVWNYLHQNKFCALVWNGYEEIMAACKAAWNGSMADPASITSIGTGERTWVSLWWGGYYTIGQCKSGQAHRQEQKDKPVRIKQHAIS